MKAISKGKHLLVEKPFTGDSKKAAELFAKYHYRMVPVVDARDCMLGTLRYKDIMKGLVTRAAT